MRPCPLFNSLGAAVACPRWSSWERPYHRCSHSPAVSRTHTSTCIYTAARYSRSVHGDHCHGTRWCIPCVRCDPEEQQSQSGKSLENTCGPKFKLQCTAKRNCHSRPSFSPTRLQSYAGTFAFCRARTTKKYDLIHCFHSYLQFILPHVYPRPVNTKKAKDTGVPLTVTWPLDTTVYACSTTKEHLFGTASAAVSLNYSVRVMLAGEKDRKGMYSTKMMKQIRLLRRR